MRVIPVPIRSDNYMYLLAEDNPSAGSKAKAFIIDPAVPDALERINQVDSNMEIVGVLTTHHHPDHAGGNAIIAKALPSIPIYGGQPPNGAPKVLAITKAVQDGDQITLGDSISVRCMATPCHTQDSICYYATEGDQKAVFTGDTLFQAGCGRFFEGTPDEMNKALSYLGTLPNDTIVYSGHEYTGGNLQFLKQVDASNAALTRLQELCDSNEITTGKSTIGDEKQWNAFMRLNSDPILKATGKTDATEVMGRLREMKNAM